MSDDLILVLAIGRNKIVEVKPQRRMPGLSILQRTRNVHVLPGRAMLHMVQEQVYLVLGLVELIRLIQWQISDQYLRRRLGIRWKIVCYIAVPQLLYLVKEVP